MPTSTAMRLEGAGNSEAGQLLCKISNKGTRYAKLSRRLSCTVPPFLAAPPRHHPPARPPHPHPAQQQGRFALAAARP